MKEKRNEVLRDYRPALQYIKNHPEITNLLLTGGDPLRLSTRSLRKVLASLREIDHVQIIRVGTKMPVYYPFRIIDDPQLPKMLKEFSVPEKRIYFMLHFSHPREITKETLRAINILLKSGVILCNQNPLLRGVNDNPATLAELFRKLSFMGVCPYYVFQCRPALGNKPFAVPIVEGYQIFERARKTVSGLAKRAKFVMSHASGKIEVIGLDKEYIYMKFQRAPDPEDNGKFIKARRNEEAYWFDDFEIVSKYSI
jgi:KamA family protein